MKTLLAALAVAATLAAPAAALAHGTSVHAHHGAFGHYDTRTERQWIPGHTEQRYVAQRCHGRRWAAPLAAAFAFHPAAAVSVRAGHAFGKRCVPAHETTVWVPGRWQTVERTVWVPGRR